MQPMERFFSNGFYGPGVSELDERAAYQVAERAAESADPDDAGHAATVAHDDFLRTLGYAPGGPCDCEAANHDPDTGHRMACGWHRTA